MCRNLTQAADAQEHAQAIQGHIKQLEAVVNGIQETYDESTYMQ